MTEIEQIKNKVELILNDDSGGSWNKNHDSDYYAKLNLAKLELLEEDIPSLITTIESQNSQIDSLKAITELAVKDRDSAFEFITKLEEQFEWFTSKTLKSIESFMEPKVMDREPIATGDQRYYETERLSNGTT